MKPASNPVFVVGERITIAGFHKNYSPIIVSIKGFNTTVRTEGLPGSERVFKTSELVKVK